MYTPLTPSATNYRTMGYWFATGHWFAQPRTDWTPDFSSDFGDYCARRRDDYVAGHATSLPSIPDLWTEYVATLDEFFNSDGTFTEDDQGNWCAVDTDPTPPHGTERPA